MPGPERARTPAPAYASRPWLASYPAGVPADLDYPRVPLTRLVDDAAASFPQRTALAFLGATITYRELQEAVDRLATGLTGLGVRKGDRVALVLPNCPQNVIATYATLRLGAVVVQNNPLYTEAELRHQLADSGATVVVCLDRNYATVAAVRADTSLRAVVVTSLADYLPARARLKLLLPLKASRRARSELTASVPKDAPVVQLRELLKSSPRAVQVPVDPETDLAVLQYTGGTTGTSKGAMLTHANLVSNAYMNRVWDVDAVAGREVTLAVLPLFHVFGFSVAMNATLLLGGTLVLLPRFDLDRVFAAIDTYRPTMFPGVPPIYKAIADSPKAALHDLRSIRLCVSGAMRLPVDTQKHFERISGATLVEGYGLTETSPSTHCNPLDGTRREGTIGLPLPGTLCRVVSQDDPTVVVAPGEPGELAVAGPQVFRGYWGQDEQDGVFTDDGYVLTGDVVVMDPDGFFTVVDRKKELIIAGGFNIYPSEVEAVLMSLPGVADAVVVGVPDRYRGETVKAYVVAEPGAALTEGELVEHCRTELTAYKVPKVVEIRDSLPRTTVGKVLRRALLEEERARAEAAAEDVPASTPGGRTRGAAAQEISPAISQTVVDAPDVSEDAVQPAEVDEAARRKAVAKAPRTVETVAPAPSVEEPVVDAGATSAVPDRSPGDAAATTHPIADTTAATDDSTGATTAREAEGASTTSAADDVSTATTPAPRVKAKGARTSAGTERSGTQPAEAAPVEKATAKKATAKRAPAERRPAATDSTESVPTESGTGKSAPANKAATAKAPARKSSATKAQAAKKSAAQATRAPRVTSATRTASTSSAPPSEPSERELPVAGASAARSKPASGRAPRKKAATSATRTSPRSAAPPLEHPADAPATSTDAADPPLPDARQKRASAGTTPARTASARTASARTASAGSTSASDAGPMKKVPAAGGPARRAPARAADPKDAASPRTAVKKVAAPGASPPAAKRTASPPAPAAPARKAVRKSLPPSKRST